MAVYSYIGINAQGKQTAGEVDADNERAARMKLRKMGVFPTKLGLQGTISQSVSMGMNINFSQFFQKVKLQDVSLMTRQLSSLLSANIQLVEALEALIDQIENPKLKNLLSTVKQKVTEGDKLADALRPYKNIFGDIYINMVEAGESSGALDVVMDRLADFTESQAKLKGKVVSAMIYPAIMSVVAIILITGLLTFVVPKVTEMLSDTGAALPLPTKILMGVSGFLTNYWWLGIIFVVAGIVGARKYISTPKGRMWFDGKKLTMPLFGNVNRMVAVSRFSRTLSTLLGSAVPLLTAIDIVSKVVDNVVLKETLEKTRDMVREGQGVADQLKKSPHFPPLVTHMIGIGEKTGELESMLERVADTYDGQVDNALSALTSLLEPLMILVMAGVVSFIVMSILLPILKLNQL
ncbi:MAG: type II secretion system protein GspF [Deltaproteobacteria bacterium CG_4_10_14_0_2_um_filter_43_8]|nr:MAG: type II secretion system protein GspF [Deltaproteobacteria bacterium CG11_big_fil_rev_8_21_14_0_20_42_23]PJA21538.1 MAG: type II secretion system protein GspF [Deltaproteobacteria bacterium CG_4_10_14_0_2_um_filter_43_8]PJC63981.1 MAG: type II secretion system protein GspF [Deltaproteobacteria bacterium CG_4_9_14_0_2_um_filter_42_21]